MSIRRTALVAVALLAAAGCKKDTETKTPADAKKEGKPAEATPAAPNTPTTVQADRTRCDRNGKKVTQYDVNHDGQPDVWKIFATVVESGSKVEVLTCKEVDLNFDRHMDMWVYYDNFGNATLEEFDLDFDGRIDLWTHRQGGRVIRQEMDTNFDAKPDIWKYFENDKLVRIERSSRRDGRIDVWEYYENGKLDRIGYDTTGSGRVDKWDRAPEEPEQPQAAPPPANVGAPAAEKKS